MPDAITPASLRDHVYVLAGQIGERNLAHPAALAETAAYIAGEWQQQGYRVVRQGYMANGVECFNLEVTRTGSQWPEEFVVIGAHYDTVPGSPGANDNGSGVATLLELSRLFTTFIPRASVRFVAFVNEEPPHFMGPSMGSRVYAEAARKAGTAIRCMASLETIGYYDDRPRTQRYPGPLNLFYPGEGNFLAFIGNLRSRHLLRRASRVFRVHSAFPLHCAALPAQIPGVAWSDHSSFWRAGYRAFMVTDTALYRYPYYHSGKDTPDKLTYEPFAEVTNALLQTFATLADLPPGLR